MERSAQSSGELKTVTLFVKGMSCRHCKMAVERAVVGVNGVTEVEVNLEKGLLKVIYDSEKAALADIKQAVINAGYEVADER